MAAKLKTDVKHSLTGPAFDFEGFAADVVGVLSSFWKI
jgi:hypothetical protein